MSEKRNVDEVTQKIKVSNHSVTKLVCNLAETKPTQSRSLFTIRCYGNHAELPNQNLKNPLGGVITLLWHFPLLSCNYRYCQASHFIWQHRKVTVRDLLWLEELYYPNPSCPPQDPDHLSLITIYQPGLHCLKRILREGFHILSSDPLTQDLLTKPPSLTFRQPPNLHQLITDTQSRVFLVFAINAKRVWELWEEIISFLMSFVSENSL